MHFRKLQVGDVEYGVFIGKTAAVIKREPEGTKTTVPLTDLTGRSADEIERGRRKGTPEGMITPADVRAYIERVGL